MKNIQFILISFFLVLTSYAQHTPNGIYFGLPGKNVMIEGLIEYYDKGYFMEGSHYINPNQNFGLGSWSAKTGINLELLRQNYIIYNSGYIETYAVASDNEGNRYTGGVLYKAGSDSPIISKYNACGETEWCRILKKGEYNQGIVVDILITDERDEIIVLLQYLYPVLPEIKDRIYLAALSNNGELLWEKVFASPDKYPLLHDPMAVKITYYKGEYYISGRCYYAYPSNPSIFYHRAFYVGIDSNFEEKWILPFGTRQNIIGDAWNILPINDRLLMGVGSRWLPTPHWYNSLIMFFDVDGNEISYTEIQSSSINPDIDYNAIRTMYQINDTTFLSLLHLGIGGVNMFGDMVFDISGNIYDYTVRGSREWVPKITISYDSNYVIGVPVMGSDGFLKAFLYKIDQNLQYVPFDSTTYVYDSLCPYPIQSGTIDLSDCMVLTSTDWIPTPKEYYARISAIPITIYPNPAKDQITFTFENTEHHKNIELRCFNLLGVLQHQIKVQRGQQQYSANIKNWAPGIYIAVVYSDGKPVGRGKFVVQ